MFRHRRRRHFVYDIIPPHCVANSIAFFWSKRSCLSWYFSDVYCHVVQYVIGQVSDSGILKKSSAISHRRLFPNFLIRMPSPWYNVLLKWVPCRFSQTVNPLNFAKNDFRDNVAPFLFRRRGFEFAIMSTADV